MNKTTLLLFTLLCAFFSAYSQTITGTYSNRWESQSGEAIAYTLTLKSDGTFIFYSNQTYWGDEGIKTTKAIGTWKSNNHLLVLTTEPDEDSNIGLIKELNNNKARYNRVSERKRLTSDEKSSLKFYQSDVFYAKNMELFKQDAIMSSVD